MAWRLGLSYAANIQWDVYRNRGRPGAGEDALQREGSSPSRRLRPIAVGFFYDFGELKRCYDYSS